MRQIVRFLVVSAALMTFMSVIIVSSPGFARAQEDSSQSDTSQSDDWQPLPPVPPAVQPDKAAPPPNLAGCWSGEMDDDRLGVGTGFVFVVQNKKKIARGTVVGLSFPDGPSASHGITGTVGAKSFKLRFQRSTCVIGIRGTFSSGDLVGTYQVTKRCLGRKLAGTFDFTSDPSGSTCH